MRKRKNKLKRSNPGFAGSLTAILAGLLLVSTLSAGCAAFKRPLIHPLPNDFTLVKAGEEFTAPKDGAFVSNFFMCRVMAVDIDGGASCKDVK